MTTSRAFGLATTPKLESLVRPTVRAMPAYEPSRPSAKQVPHRIKLDQNESTHGPSPKARAALAAYDELHRYPDFEAVALREALARYAGVPAEQIIAGAGLDDVLAMLGLVLLDEGDEVIISEPTFGVYRSVVALAGGVTVNVPLKPGYELDADGILDAVTPRTKYIMICTPNNPTGNVLDPVAVEQVVAGAPCLVAIDEAYAEFVGSTHLPLMERYNNVAILRTLSKFAGLAGMRVGYGIFPPELIPHFWRVKPPFNIAGAAMAAAIASLDDVPYLIGIVEQIKTDREALAAQLRELPGVEPFPSSTNFILVRLPVANAAPIRAALADRGILVRYFGRPDLGIADCLRVSVGSTEENEIFVRELADLLESGNFS